MRRRSQISRRRRADIADAAHQLYSVRRTEGRSADQIQAELLRTFPRELALGEARMYAMGWTVRVVREGLRGLATNDGLDASGLGDGDVWRWLRGEVRPRDWLPRLCKLFRCHQAYLGWPPQGNEPVIDYTNADDQAAGIAVRSDLPGMVSASAGTQRASAILREPSLALQLGTATGVDDASPAVPYAGAKLSGQLVPIDCGDEFITFVVNRREFLRAIGGGAALTGTIAAGLRWDGQDPYGFETKVRSSWPDIRLSDHMRDAGVDWHMVLPSGRSFVGADVPTHVLGAQRWSSQRIGATIPDTRRLSQFLAISRGLVVGAEETALGHRFFLLSARDARQQLHTRANITIPSAYELDDLTYGVLWACTNLDGGLQADDAALTNLRRRWLTMARQPASRQARDAAVDLNPVSQMWFGSDFCARHIFRHMGTLRQVPVFWTCEQKGEEASPWLLFTHKYQYLLKTVAYFRSPSALTRAFCVPEAVVQNSPTYERCLFFLAAALMESLGVEVAVISEPEYADVEGFVLAPQRSAIIANWVRSDSMWHVDRTAQRSVLDSMSDAVGHACAHSVLKASSPPGRLVALAEYLGLDWSNLSSRCRSLAAVGWSGLLGPQSRLLSVHGLDKACSFVGEVAASTT